MHKKENNFSTRIVDQWGQISGYHKTRIVVKKKITIFLNSNGWRIKRKSLTPIKRVKRISFNNLFSGSTDLVDIQSKQKPCTSEKYTALV